MIKKNVSTNIVTGYIPIDKFQLGYRIEGIGKPAIVIGSSIYYPRTFSQNLRQHLRLIFLDHRGFSPQPASLESSEYTLDTLLDDIEHIRKTLGLSRIIVIGHSVMDIWRWSMQKNILIW